MEEEFDHKLFRWIGGKNTRFTPETLSLHIYNETNSLFAPQTSLSSIRHRITCRLKSADSPIVLTADGYLAINPLSLSYRKWESEGYQAELFSEETMEAVSLANQLSEPAMPDTETSIMMFDFPE